jgi:hypothetical protein
MSTKKIQIIGNNLSSTYETKADAQVKLDEAKAYADTLTNSKADTVHSHALTDVTNLQTTLDTIYEDIKEADTKFDNALAQKSQVQIITWEADD